MFYRGDEVIGGGFIERAHREHRYGTMRFAIATLGCKVNQYDSAIIESRLGALGMERGEFNEPADVYIVNTCTVTDRADAKACALRGARAGSIPMRASS